MRGLSLADRHAALAVAMATNAICEPLEPAGSPAPRFRMLDNQGRHVGVLGVATTLARGGSFFAAGADGLTLSDPRLHSDWRAVLGAEQADFARLARVLPTLLVQAECEGYAPNVPEVLEADWTFSKGEEPQTSLGRAGVRMVAAEPARDRAGVVHVTQPPSGRPVEPAEATEAVSDVLGRPGTIERLGPPGGAGHRELFVWLMANGDGPLGLDAAPQLPACPELPAAVTRVWLGTAPDTPYALTRALWVSDGGAWESREPPVRLDAAAF